ncbi:MAG: DUF2073 domain-containing protein [Thermoplasmata archaeon]|nr:DUF2073 domain-containing protein [Thermoplasmata archaeon]
MADGIRINLISRERMDGMSPDEKIHFILSEVMGGKVLVLEEGLSPVEEAELMQRTMASIDHDTFIGIEIQGYYNPNDLRAPFLRRVFQRRTPPRMTVIGPAAHLKTIYKDGEVIQALILTDKPYIEGKEIWKPPAVQPTKA